MTELPVINTFSTEPWNSPARKIGGSFIGPWVILNFNLSLGGALPCEKTTTVFID